MSKPMNDHLYRKLKRLYDNRESVNGRDEYLRGLVSHSVSEDALKGEIERRVKK